METISISGYHIREKGCSAVQEVAFTMANAIAYVGAALDAASAIDEFAPRLAFFFNCHNKSSRRSRSSGRPAGCGRRS